MWEKNNFYLVEVLFFWVLSNGQTFMLIWHADQLLLNKAFSSCSTDWKDNLSGIKGSEKGSLMYKVGYRTYKVLWFSLGGKIIKTDLDDHFIFHPWGYQHRIKTQEINENNPRTPSMRVWFGRSFLLPSIRLHWHLHWVRKTDYHSFVPFWNDFRYTKITVTV